ncbi:helicase PIF1 [Seminavis robusta]|uniref:ATP-dependent DNA helicase n=1 Tax=Seminavis robusta TaxID=568900 RepID=A0A9N8DPK5_9STRA|nr:helicase PIF1 [Seminavis robusta]|eukprot:Sro196_g083350.1 helicase PIF1 (1205) ;mRNA; f:1134-4748
MPTVSEPTLIDNSHSVESENSDIEIKEEIKVIFPDATIRTAGCSDGAEFDKAIAEIRSKCAGVLPYLTSRPSSKLLRDYEDENLMRAYPLQFPYGFGYHEDFNIKALQNGYLSHLLSLSTPTMHQACFVLAVHNMFERCKALNGAVWRVMGGREKCDVSEEELNAAIASKLNGLPPDNGPGSHFLESVHCVKRNMAHTNAAASSAQAKFLTLTHHYGCPKVLFTVSFDDSLDIRILAWSQEEDTLNWIASMDNMSPEEVATEMDKCNAIRFKYPGLCAWNFDELIDIVLDKIVGDNSLKMGLFGTLIAYGLAVEEQGRNTLHGHILVYTAEWNNILIALNSSSQRVRKAAEKEVLLFVDRVISTELVPNAPWQGDYCPTCNNSLLTYVDEQKLRNLRHKVGCQMEKGIIAACPLCKAAFQGDELAMKRVLPKELWSVAEAERKAQVALSVLRNTTPTAPCVSSEETIAINNYKYNHHLSKHTKTCFKKGDEGRCNLPDLPESVSNIVYSKVEYDTFNWRGANQSQHNITIRPRRLLQDASTNSYCIPISTCKCPANSNVQVTTGARSAIYCTCYAAKGTQKEDTGELKKMGSYVAHRFLEEHKENTLFEGLSRLMGTVIVATSEHVVAAPMAAYLVRNHSRFKWSHSFKYIPIREIVDLLIQRTSVETMRMSVMDHEKGCFLTSEALHYLQRPKKKFETYCLVDFFQEYEIVRTDKPNETDEADGTFTIDDTEHPGYKKQIIKERKEPVLAQFSHWAFPDAASFGGDILEMNQYPVPTSVENYCRTILVLYHPFRTLQDLTIDGSFHKMFTRLYHDGVPDHIRELLSNVQMFYNSVRMPAKEDPLKHCTEQFEAPNSNHPVSEEEEEDDDNFFDGVFNLMSPQPTITSNELQMKVSLNNLRRAGGRGCGFNNLPQTDECTSFLRDSQRPTRHSTSGIPSQFISSVTSCGNHTSSYNQSNGLTLRDKPTPYQLMELTYRNTRRRLTEQEEESRSPENSVEANGTCLSIIQWSLRPDISLDKEQQLAFQIVTAAFILTYYQDAETLDPSVYRTCSNNPSQIRRDFKEEKGKLQRISRLRHNQLIMFLDGAGGAGKSRVVQELLKYAQEFTTRLGLRFDMRTIVVSAMSGVAAVSIGGETTHSVAAFYRNIDEQDTSWANARLLIIDEVSFMSTNEVDLLDEKLRCLMRKYNSLYGGIHILFCGDFR